MAEVPRYPRQYRVHDAVFSLFLMQAVTSVIETLGNRKSQQHHHGDAESIDRVIARDRVIR
ncbi:MAG: hypothetical protein ACJ71U_14380 [Terriglobales bacterium]